MRWRTAVTKHLLCRTPLARHYSCICDYVAAFGHVLAWSIYAICAHVAHLFSRHRKKTVTLPYRVYTPLWLTLTSPQISTLMDTIMELPWGVTHTREQAYTCSSVFVSKMMTTQSSNLNRTRRDLRKRRKKRKIQDIIGLVRNFMSKFGEIATRALDDSDDSDDSDTSDDDSDDDSDGGNTSPLAEEVKKRFSMDSDAAVSVLTRAQTMEDYNPSFMSLFLEATPQIVDMHKTFKGWARQRKISHLHSRRIRATCTQFERHCRKSPNAFNHLLEIPTAGKCLLEAVALSALQ